MKLGRNMTIDQTHQVNSANNKGHVYMQKQKLLNFTPQRATGAGSVTNAGVAERQQLMNSGSQGSLPEMAS